MPDQQELPSFFDSITPTVWVSLLAAILAVGSALGVASINAHAQRELEREQFESNLILKAISTGNKRQSFDNLRFLVEAHLIRAKSDKVSQLIQDTSFHFSIPTDTLRVPVTQSAQVTDIRPTFSGIVVDEATGRPLKGATVCTITKEEKEEQITGADGRFKLHYPLVRSYNLVFLRPGYYPHVVDMLGSSRFPYTIREPLERDIGLSPWQRLKKDLHLD